MRLFRKVGRFGTAILLFSLPAMSGCQSPLPPIKGAINLPTFLPGDRFTFDDGRTFRVRSVEGDTVDWSRGRSFHWTSHRDFVVPLEKWSSRTRSGRREMLLGQPGGLWPLRTGNTQEYRYSIVVQSKDGSEPDKPYEQRWDCRVGGTETVTVPAGTFETAKITCYRYSLRPYYYSGERNWYFSPELGFYVLKRDISSRLETKETALTSYRKAPPRLNQAERAVAEAILQRALQTKPSGQMLRDRRNGLTVAVTPLRTYRDRTGTYCREFRRAVAKAGREQTITRTACRAKDGNWTPIRPRRRAPSR